MTDPAVTDSGANDSGPISRLLDLARSGRRAALAKLLSVVERGGDDSRTLARLVHPLGGEAFTIGITGAPGAGKSTLTSAMCGVVRAAGDRVAVLAIDPSSPFSGGAILGDRIRMGEHGLDDGVYIRSMATRGHLGGLALATPAALAVLDAARFPWIVLETVGVGQVEIEIMGWADTTVVVVTPGWGDSVQANKAGLLEIADVFVVNKADRPGTRATVADLEQMLSMRLDNGWRPAVIETVATDGSGVEQLWEAVAAHRQWLATSGEAERRRVRRVRHQVEAIIAETLAAQATHTASGPGFEQVVADVMARRRDPWTAVSMLLGSSDGADAHGRAAAKDGSDEHG